MCVDDGKDNDTVAIVATGGGITAITLTASASSIALTPAAQTLITGATIATGTITGNTDLSSNNSGTTYNVVQSGSTSVVSLPSPGLSPGMFFRFVLTTARTAKVHISSTGINITGSFDDAGTATPSSSVQYVTYTASAAVGDTIELYGRPSGWYFTGRTTVSGGIDHSAPP